MDNSVMEFKERIINKFDELDDGDKIKLAYDLVDEITLRGVCDEETLALMLGIKVE